MKKLIFSFICILITFSCAVDGPGLPPLEAIYVLLNSDSTSVITSSSDKMSADYRDNNDGVLRRCYSLRMMNHHKKDPVAWTVNDTIYYFSLGNVSGDSIFITCKGKVDTLVEKQLNPLEIIFNGKRTYKPNYDGEIILLVR